MTHMMLRDPLLDEFENAHHILYQFGTGAKALKAIDKYADGLDEGDLLALFQRLDRDVGVKVIETVLDALLQVCKRIQPSAVDD